MEPSGPGSLVMIHEPPEPGGYTMGHPFNQIVFSQFENLDFKDEWVRAYNFQGGTPPQKYVFSRGPNDGLHEDDLYGILNVEQTCPQTAVKKAFTTQSRKWHPDKCDPAVAESAAMRTRWIIAAYKILSDVEARAFWDRRLARIARERRPVEPIAPKRRPRMRGSAAAASAATATVTPLQREAERLAAARSRADQANRAIAGFMDDPERAARIINDLDGLFAFIMNSNASTSVEFIKEIEKFCKDKIADWITREYMRERDGLTENWIDQGGNYADAVAYHLNRFRIAHYAFPRNVEIDEINSLLRVSRAISFDAFLDELRQSLAPSSAPASSSGSAPPSSSAVPILSPVG